MKDLAGEMLVKKTQLSCSGGHQGPLEVRSLHVGGSLLGTVSLMASCLGRRIAHLDIC